MLTCRKTIFDENTSIKRHERNGQISRRIFCMMSSSRRTFARVKANGNIHFRQRAPTGWPNPRCIDVFLFSGSYIFFLDSNELIIKQVALFWTHIHTPMNFMPEAKAYSIYRESSDSHRSHQWTLFERKLTHIFVTRNTTIAAGLKDPSCSSSQIWYDYP